jgi:hypothetical protein
LLTPPTNGTGKFYIPNGVTHCPKKYYDGVTNPFSYKWINNDIVTVNIAPGYYDIHDLNAAFKMEMWKNTHYLVKLSTNAAVFLMNIAYNSYYEKVELQVFSTANYPITFYSAPMNSSWSADLHTPDETVPQFIITNNEFCNIVGFSSGNYPNIIPKPATQNQGFISNITNSIRPSYKVASYKPNNTEFAQRGGVSGSSLILRKKYNTIQTAAASYRNTLGPAVTNAMAYGVSDQVYTLKSRLGYPMKKTPVISKSTGELKCVIKIPNVNKSVC